MPEIEATGATEFEAYVVDVSKNCVTVHAIEWGPGEVDGSEMEYVADFDLADVPEGLVPGELLWIVVRPGTETPVRVLRFNNGQWTQKAIDQIREKARERFANVTWSI